MSSESNNPEHHNGSSNSDKDNYSENMSYQDKQIPYYLLESLHHLSQLKTNDPDQILIQAIHDVYRLFHCRKAFIYIPSETSDQNPVIKTLNGSWFEEVTENTELDKLMYQGLTNKKPLFVNTPLKQNNQQFNDLIQNLIIVPVSYNKQMLALAFGDKTENFTEAEGKHLHLFLQTIYHQMELIVNKQKLLYDKERAESDIFQYYEIQKVGKIGWYEAFFNEGLFVGSEETHHVFFDKYEEQAVTLEKVLTAIHPDDRQYFLNIVQSNVEKKSPEFDWEYRVVTPKSEIKYVYSKAFLKFDENGNLIRRFGIVQDITETKKRELEIKQHNDRLESLLKISQFKANSAKELFDFALNETIRLTQCKLGYILMVDEQKNSLHLKSSLLVDNTSINPDEYPEFELPKSGYLARIIKTHEPYLDNECKEITENDTPFLKQYKLVNLLAVPVVVNNQVVALTGLANKPEGFNDFDVKQISLMMENVWKIIENHNYQEQLILAKEKAEESDKLKSAFLANMSHEIRTPMNGIIGFSELIVQPDITEERRASYANIVIESGKQLLTIVDDILDISKIEVGQINIQNAPVNLNDLMMEVFSFFSPKAKSNNLSLFLYKALPDTESVVLTDKHRLLQIINNLLSNAFKFTNQGEISFGYKMIDHQLEFYVKDTGTGIPEHMKDIVFERFRQAQQHTSQKQRGTGLGLSISKRLVELLGGKIWVETTENQGSSFFFTIPYVLADSHENHQKNSLLKDIENQKKFTLLIAEDEEINFLYLSELFNNHLTDIIHARNGVEAVELCQKNPDIDLVLMDIKMPGMDGLEATRQIKAFRSELPIVAQTAFAMETDREKALMAGCNEYLSKPIVRENLKKAIEKYIPAHLLT